MRSNGQIPEPVTTGSPGYHLEIKSRKRSECFQNDSLGSLGIQVLYGLSKRPLRNFKSLSKGSPKLSQWTLEEVP